MKRKTVWLVMSLLTAAALVLASCTTASEPAEEETTTAPTTTAPTTTAPAVASDEPVYGGWANISAASEPQTFDPAFLSWIASMWLWPVADKMVAYDWWKGPAGTNEWPFDGHYVYPAGFVLTAGLAESWEMPTTQELTIHLREGVMWPAKEGIMESRELTADDIVWNTERFVATETHSYATMAATPTAVAIDRYTVKFTLAQPDFRMITEKVQIEYPQIPPEVIEVRGDMTDWRDVTGTGAYKLTDYIEGSSMTFEKNDIYWEKDLEGRSLPYLDGFKAIIITDLSTRLAALRSGRIDFMLSVSTDDAVSLEETNPELERRSVLRGYVIKLLPDMKGPPFGPTDDPDALKVRRALALAIDHEGIAEDFYEGQALMHPTAVLDAGLGVASLVVADMPPDRKKLFEYRPDEARQLLTDAGYPEGIKIKFGVRNSEADFMSLVKAYWDAVGIETELVIMENAAHAAVLAGFTMEGVMAATYGFGSSNISPYVTEKGKPAYANWNSILDPDLDALNEAQLVLSNMDERLVVLADVVLGVIDNAYEITLPTPYVFNYWWPWLGGYSGEGEAGFGNYPRIMDYVWVDTAMKEEMGH